MFVEYIGEKDVKRWEGYSFVENDTFGGLKVVDLPAPLGKRAVTYKSVFKAFDAVKFSSEVARLKAEKEQGHKQKELNLDNRKTGKKIN